MRTIAEEMLSRINAEIKLLNYDNDITQQMMLCTW